MRARAAIATPRAVVSTPVSTLAALDWDDDSGARTRIAPPPAALVEATRTHRRRWVHRMRWFALGVVAGALFVFGARGDVTAAAHGARAWIATGLRALKHAD